MLDTYFADLKATDQYDLRRTVLLSLGRLLGSRRHSVVQSCDIPDYNQAFAGMTALGRAGVPDDIGPMVASLLGPNNRWANGQRIEASGGQTI